MKKKSFILMMALSIICMLTACEIIKNTPEKVLSKLRKLNTYESSLEIVYSNAREQRKEECNQYYSKDNGYLLKIGEGRTYFYKDGNINVTDNIAQKKYIVDDEFDEVYKYTCIDEVLNLSTNDDTKITTREHEDKSFLIVEVVLPGVNRNLAKGELIVDMENAQPQQFNIYDLKGEERIKINYRDFTANQEIDKEVFEE